MSRHHASKAHQTQQLFKQINETPEHEWYNVYGILVDDDGWITDTCYNKTFETLQAWVEYNVEMEALEDDSSSMYGGFDDE